MKKAILAAVCFAFSGLLVFAQSKFTAEALMKGAVEKENVIESIEYINSRLDQCETPSDKRAILYFEGTLQEQAGLYTDASYSYALAAGIAAKDAAGMPKVSSEQLVLNAVRASLNAGDWETAQKYLNSPVRSSKNENIIATVNLYSVWASLCKARDITETEDSVALLKAYVSMQSMKSVKSAVLLTLWYLTAEKEYALQLVKEFPESPEAGIVKGSVLVMSSPFWYFVPRAVHDYDSVPVAEAAPVVKNEIPVSAGNSSGAESTGAASTSTSTSTSASTSASTSTSSSADTSKSSKVKAQQLGLFKDKANAEALVAKVQEKGFKAYIVTEKRSSGTTYYLVMVDENAEGTMGLKLKSAGFECYGVFE